MKHILGVITFALAAASVIKPTYGQERLKSYENKEFCFAVNEHEEINATITWSGKCVGSRAEGYGTEVWKILKYGEWKEIRYTGVMRNGLRHGHGVLVMENGDKYEGNFRNDEMTNPSSIVAINSKVKKNEAIKKVDMTKTTKISMPKSDKAADLSSKLAAETTKKRLDKNKVAKNVNKEPKGQSTAKSSNPELDQCHSAIKKILNSPSSYRPLKYGNIEIEKAFTNVMFANKEVYEKGGGNLALLAHPAMQVMLAKKKLHKAMLIEYDAQNGFGALLRGGAMCFWHENGRVMAAKAFYK
jgi:hypothetical protein